jgi:hypothetical protein
MTTALVISAGLALLVWLPVGARTLDLLIPRRAQTASATALAIGSGIWALVVLAAGSLGQVNRVTLLVLGLGGSALAVWTGFRRAATDKSAGTPALSVGVLTPSLVMSGAGVGFALLVLGSALAPELSFDALNVHLPYSRQAAASGRIGFSPNNWSSAMPALPLMSYITAFTLSGVTSAKLFNWIAYLLCGAVIFSFVRNWFGLVPASAAAALFLVSPLPLYEATTALIDLPLALYSTVAVLAVLHWTASDESNWLRLGGAAFGFALSCKYHAAFWGLPLAIVIVWHSLRRRDAARVIVFRLGGFLGIAALLFSPWLVRAWIFTGNPVFPLANGFFKSPWFTPAMDAAARAAYENEGVGTSLRALLALPWTVTFHPGPFRGTPGWIFPLGILFSVVRRPDPRIRYGLLTALIFFYTWAMTAQEIRYLLPLIPLLAVLTAFGFFGNRSQSVTNGQTRSAETLRRQTHPTNALATCIATAAVLAYAATSWPSLHTRLYTEWTYWHSWKSPLRYLTGRESLQDYVKRDVPSIRVYDYANTNLTPADRILLLNDSAQYYSRIPTLYSFTVEGERILLEESETGVLRRLVGSHITHVLLNCNGLAPLPRVAPRQGAYFFLDKRFQERYLQTVYVDNNVFLFRVRK